VAVKQPFLSGLQRFPFFPESSQNSHILILGVVVKQSFLISRSNHQRFTFVFTFA
jgi:hypothetical protein